MRSIRVEVTEEEYKLLKYVLKNATIEDKPDKVVNKKWVHEGNYLVNTVTGARLNKFTKKREC